MRQVRIPCVVGEIIYYPVPALPIPIRLRVKEVRLTEYGVIVSAINARTGEKIYFPEIDFGVKVFAGEEGREAADKICEKQREQKISNE